MSKKCEQKQHVPIFVGSTYEDLKEYRTSVKEALHQLETIVHGMEYFGSRTGSPKEECLEEVRKCKIYIGIFAMRYGSIDKETGKSMTHLEYDEAQRLGLPSLIYLIDEENQPVLPKFVDKGEKGKKLADLKAELKDKFTVGFFTTPENLARRISQDIPRVLEKIGIGIQESEEIPAAITVDDNADTSDIKSKKASKHINRQLPKDPIKYVTTEVLQTLVDDAIFNARGGVVAYYIPELRMALEGKTGIALHFVYNKTIAAGDHRRYMRRKEDGSITEVERAYDDSFTLQGISKVFALLYVLEQLGHEKVFKRVGKEPTGDPFNAAPRVKKVGDVRMPYNPLINVGAILITSLFPGRTGEERFNHFLEFVKKLCGAENMIVDEAIYQSERSTGHNNRALAWQMGADGVFQKRKWEDVLKKKVNELSEEALTQIERERVEDVRFVEDVLNNYFRQCSILVTCDHLTRAACILANRGIDPDTGKRIVEEENVVTVLSLMSTCGMYDGSAEFAQNIGIPAISGVGGGIMCVVTEVLGIATFAPPLDYKGNSVRGLYMLEHLSRKYHLSIFQKPPITPVFVKYSGSEALEEMAIDIKNNVIPPHYYKKADYIPELDAANASHLGVALCFKDRNGKINLIGGGDHDVEFTLQSISNVFGLLYVLSKRGEGAVFNYVGKEPSGEAFYLLKWKVFEDEYSKRRVPFNPMINAGAIVISAMIPGKYEYKKEKIFLNDKVEEVVLLNIDEFLDFVRLLCKNPEININWPVFESERKTSNKNRSLAYIMNDEGVFGNLLRRHNKTIDSTVIEDILGVYFRLCSIEVTCDDLARFAAVLANGGRDLDTGEHLIPPRHVTIVTAMMSSTGLHDGSGEFAYRVGVPAKSGVSGGIVGLVPGKLGIAAYSPIVDDKGNSYRGQIIFERISKTENLSIFNYKW